MHPIIVLEGPDGAGKTTVAEHLKTVHGFKVIHLTYRFKDRMLTYHTAALRLAVRLAEKTPVVIDRWWPSEGVYADAYRGGSAWPLMPRFLHRQALRHGVYYMWCLPNDKYRYLRHFNELKGKRPEMYDAGMDRVYDGYYHLLHDKRWFKLQSELPKAMRSGDNWALYDWTQWPDTNIWADYLETIVKDAYMVRSVAERAAPTIRVTGNTISPKVIFVGDRSNTKGRQEWPPFAEYGNCSLWLTGVFDTCNVREDQLAVANVHAPSGLNDMIVIGWLKNLTAAGHRHIVAMGAHAGTTLEAFGIQAAHRIKHPQYYKRFHPEAGYAAILNIFMEAGLR